MNGYGDMCVWCVKVKVKGEVKGEGEGEDK